jgi:hypothetical protein
MPHQHPKIVSMDYDCHTNNALRIALSDIIELSKFREAKLLLDNSIILSMTIPDTTTCNSNILDVLNNKMNENK